MRQGIAGLTARISAARAGDRTAFAAICEQTLTPVFRYVSARVSSVADAEEITQEVFVAAMGSIPRLRADSELGLLAWLYQIARHKMADHLRRRYRQDSAPLDDAREVASSERGPEDAAMVTAERDDLVGALAALTPEQREVLVYKYVLEYDNYRTGVLLRKTPNAINQLHHRALNSLHRILDGMAAGDRSAAT